MNTYTRCIIPFAFLLALALLPSCASQEFAKAHQPGTDRSYLLDASLQAEDFTGLPPHNGGANSPELTRSKK